VIRRVDPWLVAAFAVLLAMVVVLVACTRDTTLEDLDNKNQDIVKTQVSVFQMPDQFPNIVFFCNGPTGVYVNTRQANSTNLNPNDPKCHAG